MQITQPFFIRAEGLIPRRSASGFVDFIVDSLGMKINENMTEHIDGLRTYCNSHFYSDEDELIH